MNLDEAIEHCKDISSSTETCRECANEHYQLLCWLTELKNLRKFKEEILGVIFK